MLLDAQSLTEKTHYGGESLIGAEFEDALCEMRGRAYWMQTDGYCE